MWERIRSSQEARCWNFYIIIKKKKVAQQREVTEKEAQWPWLGSRAVEMYYAVLKRQNSINVHLKGSGFVFSIYTSKTRACDVAYFLQNIVA